MADGLQRAKALAEEAQVRPRSGQVVVRSSEATWESAPGRRTAYLSEPEILNSFVQTMSMQINDLLPGESTPHHRHMNESIMFILSGRGHTIVDGEQHDWAEGDVVTTPLLSWHSHHNDDPEQPVRYIGVTNVPLLRATGLYQRDEDHIE